MGRIGRVLTSDGAPPGREREPWRTALVVDAVLVTRREPSDAKRLNKGTEKDVVSF